MLVPKDLGKATVAVPPYDRFKTIAATSASSQARVVGLPAYASPFLLGSSVNSPEILATKLRSEGTLAGALNGITPSDVLVVGGFASTLWLSFTTIHPHLHLAKFGASIVGLFSPFGVPKGIRAARDWCHSKENSSLGPATRVLDLFLSFLEKPVIASVAPDLSRPMRGYAFRERSGWVFVPVERPAASAPAVSPPASAPAVSPPASAPVVSPVGTPPKSSYGRFQLPPLGARPAVWFSGPQLANIFGISAANLIEPRQGPSAGPKINPSQPKA